MPEIRDKITKPSRISSWKKLNHRCEACKEEHADIEFVFDGNGVFGGQRAMYWHWKCLPLFLQRWQEGQAATTPPGESS